MAERLRWNELPASVVAFVHQALDGTVTDAASQHTGFSPGSADVVRTAGGGSAFVRAVDRERFPESFDLLRREAEVLWAMPEGSHCAPILAAMNDGDWLVVITGTIDGRRHPDPLAAADHLRVLDAIAKLPAEGPPELPPLIDELAALFGVWPDIADEVVVDGWAAADHVGALAALGERAADAMRGTALVHADLRMDTVLMHTGGACLVDWPWASLGSPWFDAVTYLLDVRVHGGALPERWFAHAAFAGATEDDVSALLAGLAAYCFEAASWPPHPDTAEVSRSRRDRGVAALGWLRERCDLG
jgi:hypothetical protein